MRASRGMGAINADKMPKGKKILRKDALEPVEIFKEGGGVGLYDNINAKRKRIAAGSGSVCVSPVLLVRLPMPLLLNPQRLRELNDHIRRSQLRHELHRDR